MDKPFLETRQVVKRYASHTALNGVSIQVPEGKVFGLLGPNGAGKTTLIRIINRITAPDSGEVYFRSPFTAGRYLPHRIPARRTGTVQENESRRSGHLPGPAERTEP